MLPPTTCSSFVRIHDAEARLVANHSFFIEFAHVLELLETDFYKQALAKFVPQDFVDAGIPVPDIAIQNFQAILDHEAAHTLLYVPVLFHRHFIN